MDHIDSKYIGIISCRLEKFKRVKADLFNFRCPLCGDSKKSKSKTRGYLYSMKRDTNFKCHNCGVSMTFNNFLKQLDPMIQKQYVFEKFKDGKTGKATIIENPQFNFEKPIFKKKINLPRASENSSASGYLTARMIDPSKFYFAENFKAFVNSHKETFEDVRHDEPRIIIPLFYENNLVGFQGRSLGPSKVKYITIMLDDDAPKIYGLDEIDRSKPIYVTEGPFDSTFLCNAIAMCGADADISKWGINDPVWIYDNEPRNREILQRIAKTIQRGDKIVIWPSSIEEKDINDMVMAGHDVRKMIESNTYSGLEAQLKFNLWKKI